MIQTIFREIIKKTFNVDLAKIDVEFPKELSFGDVALPIAMQLGKQLKKNPREVAETLVTAIKEQKLPEIAKIEVAGPGFVNITFTPEYLIGQIKEGFEKYQEENKTKKILLEYGSENIAKSMTVGHLRSNIIGQACANMYKTLGWDVTSDSHIGDWGLQFGKLIVAYRMWGDKKTIEKDPINELVKLYIRFHEEEEKDEKFTDEARAEFAKLEKGDAENKKLWQWFYDASMKEFHELHKILGIHHDTELGESFYFPWLSHIVELCKEKKIAIVGEDGAVYIDFGKGKQPLYILKKDGSTLYSTRDLAAIEYRLTEYLDLKRMVYFVDYSQRPYFEQLFATAKKLGWYCDFNHAYFGLVRLPEGKMSTRKGNVVYLRELIAEGIKRAHEVLEEKKVDLSDAEKEELARMIALGAIKFGDLVHNRASDVVFSWDTAISFDGDTAAYLQYTYARIKSIMRKGEYKEKELKKVEFTLPIEQHLLSFLSRLPVIVTRAAESYEPHILAQYLLHLAALFNQFYNDVPVLKAGSDVEKAMRLYLIARIARTIQQGLELLGIEVPEKM